MDDYQQNQSKYFFIDMYFENKGGNYLQFGELTCSYQELLSCG